MITRAFFFCFLMMSAPALAQDNRGINFQGMDTDNSGFVTQTEWMVWFLPDARARLLEGPKDESRAGMIAKPMGVSPDMGEFSSDSFNRELRGSALSTGPSLLEERDRLRAFDGRQEPNQPEFSMFDRNGDGKVTRDEISRRSPRLPVNATGPNTSQNY